MGESIDTNSFSYQVFFGRFKDSEAINNLTGRDCREIEEFFNERIAAVAADWRHVAYARLGVLRDSMTTSDVKAVQTFLDHP